MSQNPLACALKGTYPTQSQVKQKQGKTQRYTGINPSHGGEAVGNALIYSMVDIGCNRYLYHYALPVNTAESTFLEGGGERAENTASSVSCINW